MRLVISGAGKLPPRREMDQWIGGRDAAARRGRKRNWMGKRCNNISNCHWTVENSTRLGFARVQLNN